DALTCTESEPPLAASVTGPHESTWLPSPPAIVQFGLSGLSAQWTGVVPVPPGRLSEIVTPVASATPLFVTVTVKPMGLPAFTEAASAVLVMLTFGVFLTFHSS